MSKQKLKSVLSKGSVRWGILVGLIAVEVLLVAFLRFAAGPASHAFLIKNGKQYMVFWSQDGRYESASYGDLKDALSFARRELGLEEGTSVNGASLETLWMQDRAGSFTLNWKTFQFAHLNHLTFNRESEAKFFESAFRKGSYTPSPFGHSVLLLPVRQN
jgi:hypothetical protein